jgi:hypothetical protein
MKGQHNAGSHWELGHAYRTRPRVPLSVGEPYVNPASVRTNPIFTVSRLVIEPGSSGLSCMHVPRVEH